MLTIIQILENLLLLGVNTMDKYQNLVKYLLCCEDVMTDVLLLQLVYVLKSIVDYGCSQLSDENNGQIEIVSKCMSFEEMLDLWLPFIQKKNILGKRYSFDVVQKLFSIVRHFNFEESEQELNFAKFGPSTSQMFDTCKKTKSKKRKQPVESSDVEYESEDDCIDFDLNRKFSKFFEYKKKYPVTISQQIQFVSNDERKKITTPGEEGTHLVKIELTDTRDLQTCKGEKFYWQKVAKKGVFLLNVKKNESDKKTYENLLNILGGVGEKLSKIKNAKFETISIDSNRK